jgi:hypothetical protein
MAHANQNTELKITEIFSWDTSIDNTFELTKAQTAETIRIYGPILTGIASADVEASKKSPLFIRSERIFYDLRSSYEAIDPECSAARYAQHSALIFALLIDTYPQFMDTIPKLVSSCVKGVIAVNREFLDIDDTGVVKLYRDNISRNDGTYISHQLSADEKKLISDFYLKKWQSEMPSFVFNTLTELDELRRVFMSKLDEAIHQEIQTSLNRNLFGVTVLELFRDNHLYLTPLPIQTSPNQAKDITLDRSSRWSKFRGFASAFQEKRDLGFPLLIPNFNVPPICVGVSANFSGLEKGFQRFLKALSLKRLHSGIFDGQQSNEDIERVLCRYALFATYCSMVFGRYHRNPKAFFRIDPNSNRINIPLLGVDVVKKTLLESEFLKTSFTFEPRFGAIVNELLEK